MSYEQLEQRLRAAYDATEHLSPPDFDVSRAGSTQPRRTGPRLLAVAAATVVVAGVAALLYGVLSPSSHSRSATAQSASASSTPSGPTVRTIANTEPPSIVPTAPVRTDSLSGATGRPGEHSGFEPVHVLHSVPSGHYESLPWRLMKVVDGGRALRIEYVTGDGSCVVPRGFVVLESRTSVELLALSEHILFRSTRPDVRVACPAMLVTAAGVVRLTQPLGDRALLHGPTSPGWPQRLLG